MPSNNGNSVKNKRILNFNNNDFSIPNGHGDDNYDDDNYLGPQFDSEILDLDEDISDEEIESHVNLKDIKAYNKKPVTSLTNKEKSNSDICTVIGTNCFGRKIPFLIFSVEAVLRKDNTIRKIGERYNLSYKIYKTDCKLLKTILNSHGFLECQSYSNDYNLLWTGGHVKPYTLRTMSEHQKVNHFPRSYELTRKDRLFKNIQKMQQLKGLKHFDFVPPSYLIPSEFQELCHNFSKEKNTYIVKPIALSRGRGIFLSNHPGQIPLEEQLIASKYISNPYLINELKFDIRMYVLVTSYDPLVVYLYEEGLTRFATVKYQNTPKNLKTQCMHLTNYSVNKKNNEFIHNDDADVEDFGNKWSLGALLRYLKSKNVDTTCLMMKIEDIIVKSLISVEAPISATSRMFQTYRSNCFELYGYDIIIDENLRPWLLEVNLSPSLSCDSPLDFKIKSHMMSDMFSLIGIGCEDPVLNNPNQPYLNSRVKSSNNCQFPTDNKISRQINTQNSSIRRPTAGLRRRDLSTSNTPFKSDQLRMIRRVKEEFKRKGGWIRIFPTSESLETYFPLFQTHNSEQTNTNNSVHNHMNLNRLLYSKLFPHHIVDIDNFTRSNSQNQAIIKSRISLHSVNYNSSYHKDPFNQLLPTNQGTYKRISQNYGDTQTRIPYYERKLGEEPQMKNLSEQQSFQDPIKTANANTMENNIHDSDNDMLSSSSSISLSDKDNSMNNSDSDIEDYDDEHSSTNSHNIPSSMSQSSKEILSVDRIVQSGGKLTKLQARMAFSNYLSRVQRRLLLECRSEESNIQCESENNSHEQIELVIRFLKRAATNMSPNEFEIPTVPSRTQPLNQRQEWLAKLLGNFIKIYSRETSIATSKEIETAALIDKKSFLYFLRVASENDLETTLSNYTRINKSAGIFLNPNLNTRNPESTPDDSIRRPPTAGLHKSVSMTNLTIKDKPTQETFQKSSKPIYKPLTNKTQSSLQINKDNYSQKQTPYDNNNNSHPKSFSRPNSVNQTIPWRPGSTKLTNNNNNTNNNNHPRPLTSNAINSKIKITNKPEKCYDPDAISKALQRLATDQRNRQLTASVFSFYDSDFEQQNQKPKLSNFDPLAKTLIRQYQQSKKLLQESRAKHNAILLSQNSVNNSDLLAAGGMPRTTSNLTNKPPPGIRSNQSAKLLCAPRK